MHDTERAGSVVGYALRLNELHEYTPVVSLYGTIVFAVCRQLKYSIFGDRASRLNSMLHGFGFNRPHPDRFTIGKDYFTLHGIGLQSAAIATDTCKPKGKK